MCWNKFARVTRADRHQNTFMKIDPRRIAVFICGGLLAFACRAVAAPGDVETGFNPNANGSVFSLSIQPDGKIVMGGDFTSVGGTNINYLARLNADGTLVSSFNPSVSNSVFCTAVLADGKIVAGGAFSSVAGATLNRVAWLNLNGTLSAGYLSDADNFVYSTAIQVDGKVVLGGLFTTLSGAARNRIARLAATSSLDFSFDPNAGGAVFSTAIQTNGRIVIGGTFGSVGGFPRINLARINADNTLDLSFSPNVSGSVYCTAIQADGKIVIGGNFTGVAGVSRSSIARLNADGTLDTGFDPVANSDVDSMAVQSDGKIVIGGNFTSVGGLTRNYLARLNTDGTPDTNFNPDANSTVKSLAIQLDGKILIGGNFTSVGGVARTCIARLLNDAATENLSIPNANRIEWLRGGSSPETLQVTFEKSIDGGSVWTSLGVGTRITGGWELIGLNLLGNGQVRARARIIGGQYNGSSGLIETTTAFSLPAPEMAVKGGGITITNGDLTPAVTDYTDFGSALTNGGTVVRTFTIENTGSAALNLAATPRVQISGAQAADFTVTQPPPASVFTGSEITFQVTFHPSASGLRTATVSIVNDDTDENPYSFAIQGTGSALGDADAGFNFTGNRRVNSIAVQANGKIVFGGTFTNVGGLGRNRIARLNADGTLDTNFVGTVGSAIPAIVNSVRSIVLQTDGRILIGGQFPNVDGGGHPQLSQLNADGTLDPTFNPPSPNGLVNSMTLQPDKKIIIGGAFSTIGGSGGVVRFHVARLNPDGSVDPDFDPNADAEVYSTALQADGKIIVGGPFATVGGIARNGIARLNTDGTPDTNFNPDANSYVISAAVQPDGKILIGGNFTTIGGTARNHIARLNSDGTLDLGFDPNVNAIVYSMALQADGRIVIAGEFSTVGGVARSRIARLNANGTLDSSFNPNANNFVYAVALQADGSVVMGGDFSAVGALTRNRVARLVNEPAIQSLTAASANRIQWLRGGAAPEIFQVTFELSVDSGDTWGLPAAATPILGGWELTGLSLPAGGYIRARARTTGGDHNSSYGLLETVANFPSGPDMAVEQPLNTTVVNRGTRDFGHLAVGANTNLTFTIRNIGQFDLTGLGITVDGPDVAMFTVVASPTSPVPAGGSTVFTVRFVPTSDGAKMATLHIANNDPDENPFDIILTGTGPGPEIAVKGNSADIDDGDTTPSITNHTEFGSALVNGGTVVRTFTIENSGPLPLNLTGTPRVQIGGAQAADFSVTLQPATPVSSGSNTTFQVTFDPSAAGLRTATLSIACDDADENPYNFSIQGNGSMPSDVDTGFNPNADRTVQSLAVQPDGKVIIGGAFINVAGVARNNFARVNANGTLDTVFNPDPGGGNTTSIAVKTDGKIMIGGQFTMVSGLARSHLARINGVGTLDTGFNPTLTVNNIIYSLALQADGNFVMGGGFNLVAGFGRNGIARVSGNGILDAFNPNPDFYFVSSVALQADGKFVFGGSFGTVGGATRNCVARVNADGTLDGFDPNANNVVYCVAVQADGKIIIAGDFTMVGGVTRNKIARVNADGTLDAAFDPNVSLTVYSMALQADGKMVIGGRFTTVGGVARSYIARLNADGTLDSGFSPNVNDVVDGVAVQSDGKIVVAGDFITVGGVTRNHIARLMNDLATQSLTVPDRSRVQWLRGGTSPETHQVAFDLSIDDGSTWTPIGAGVRISGGWELIGLNLPTSGQVRARARVMGGQYSGSSGLLETVTTFSIPYSALENWRLTYFGNPANTGAGADLNDFDQDGIINVVEFAFGLDPTQNSAGQLPQPHLINNNLVVSFTEPAGVSGINYGAEWSARLTPGSWTLVSDTGITPQHTFSVPIGTNETLFIQLKITRP